MSRHLHALPGGSHIINLRPTTRPVHTMPDVTLFDHQSEPDVPVMPWQVRDALRVMLRSVNTPMSEARQQIVEAASIINHHFRVLDDCAPHGIPRPGAS